jgi:hypothetical protein
VLELHERYLHALYTPFGGGTPFKYGYANDVFIEAMVMVDPGWLLLESFAN